MLITNTLVDGRSVSKDGAKLDGIEAGATVDQLASEVPFVPAGTISSKNVQLAISELDSSTQAALGTKVTIATDETITGAKTFSNAIFKMTNLPTSDPKVAGQLWNNAGALTLSAG